MIALATATPTDSTPRPDITHANAAGRVLVRFVIGSDGRVIESVVANRTYPVQGVAECIAHAVARWVFSAPAGGVVVVNYPFNLLAEENAASEPTPARAPARPRPNRGRSR